MLHNTVVYEWQHLGTVQQLLWLHIDCREYPHIQEGQKDLKRDVNEIKVVGYL